MEKIKWAVCDDAFYSCYIYVSKLESIEALESVGHCLKSADLPDLIRTKEPDVLLLDIQMESTTSRYECKSNNHRKPANSHVPL